MGIIQSEFYSIVGSLGNGRLLGPRRLTAAMTGACPAAGGARLKAGPEVETLIFLDPKGPISSMKEFPREPCVFQECHAWHVLISLTRYVALPDHSLFAGSHQRTGQIRRCLPVEPRSSTHSVLQAKLLQNTFCKT